MLRGVLGRCKTGNHKSAHKFLCNECGQETVEMAIVFPIVIIIAVIAVNATLFFSDCAAFDRQFRQAVVALAPSPAYGQDSQNVCSAIEGQLSENLNGDNIELSVSAESISGGYTIYKGKIEMYPTLFGMGLKRSVFGVPLPSLSHNSQMTVETYKPGVIF